MVPTQPHPRPLSQSCGLGEGRKRGDFSIFLRGDGGKLGEGLFHGGLVAVHEVLGAAEALDAVEPQVPEGSPTPPRFK